MSLLSTRRIRLLATQPDLQYYKSNINIQPSFWVICLTPITSIYPRNFDRKLTIHEKALDVKWSRGEYSMSGSIFSNTMYKSVSCAGFIKMVCSEIPQITFKDALHMTYST